MTAKHCRLLMLLAVVALCTAACSSAGPPVGESFKVVQVRDGDTIVVSMNGRNENVRLLGVDTPEMNYKKGEPDEGALAATLFTREKVEGAAVGLQADPLNQDRDHYGRLLRYVYLPDGALLNQELIRNGYGFAFLEFPLAKREQLVKAEIEARNEGRGLWAPNRIQSIPYDQAHRFEGRVVAAHGVIVAAKTVDSGRDGRLCFLNFHKDYKRFVSVVVREPDFSRFGGDPEERYRGEAVTVTGQVRDYRGRLQIRVVDPGQITGGD